MMRALLLAGVVTFAFGWTTEADATYIVTFQETAGNVVANGSGSLNITGLSKAGDFSDTAFISPGRNIALIGGANETVYNSILSYSSVLGTGGTLESASSGTGGLVGVLGGNNQLAVPQGYLSGTMISNTSLFAGQTLASLGLIPGTVAVSFNSGVNADTIRFQIVSPVTAVPEPASLILLGMGVVGIAVARQRNLMVGEST